MINLTHYSETMRQRVTQLTIDQQGVMVPIVERALQEIHRGGSTLPVALEEIRDAATMGADSSDMGDALAHELAAHMWQGMLLQRLDTFAVET